MSAIPILLYHGINTKVSDRMAPFAVSPDDFSRHMDLLVQKQYQCITLSNLVDSMRASQPLERVAVVTFDDGYADFNKFALPVLQARAIPATMYLTSGWINGGTSEPVTRPDDEFLDWSHVPELVAAGIEIGAHSHTHPQMDTLDTAAAVYELSRSKALIEDAVGAPVRSFAYPHGYSSPALRKLTADAGYDSATAVRNMFSHQHDDLFRLARLMLMNTHTVDNVEKWLDGTGASLAPTGEGARTKSWRAYRRAKAIVQRQPGTDYA